MGNMMASEFAHLGLSLLTGACIATSVTPALLSQLGKSLNPEAFVVVPIWLNLFMLPLFLYAWRTFTYLRLTRINNCQLAPSFREKVPIVGYNWVTTLSKAMKEFRFMETLQNILETHNNTLWVWALGDSMVYTNEPENVKAMLGTNFDDWKMGGTRRLLVARVLGKHAIFSVNGQEWMHARAMIRPSFVRNQIADLDCTDRHAENLMVKLSGGTKVDIQELWYDFMMDVSTDFMFGHSTDLLVDPSPEAQEFMQCFNDALLMGAKRALMGSLALRMPNKKLDHAVATCWQFVDRFVVEAMKDDSKAQERPYVFMNEIIKSGASKEEVRSQLMSMIIGGRDTSASTLSALFWTLARRSDVVAKIREELKQLEGGNPTWQELRDLKYLNMVVKEALRLYSPVSTNSRHAVRDTVLPRGGGPDGKSPIFMPKGSSCRWSSFVMHRNKNLFGEDAEDFRPERWETLRVRWEYIPFGAGPRVCIGQQFAVTQMLYIVARIFQTFQGIKAEDEMPLEYILSSTMILRHGCWVSFDSK